MLRPLFTERCAELAARPGRPSLDHNDLHALNIVRGAGDPASLQFFDWGDAVVAHPFACMLVPLDILAPRGPNAVRQVIDAYLQPFASLAPLEQLHGTVRLACWVAKVARALTWERSLLSAGPEVDATFARAPFEHVEALRLEGAELAR